MAPVNLSGLTVDPAHPLSRGLVGWWLLNERGGNGVRDISTYSNHGLVKNVTQSQTSGWTGHRFGSALRFDGVNDYVEVPYSKSFDLTDEFSVSIWLTFSSVLATPGQAAVFIGRASTGAPFWMDYDVNNVSMRFITTNATGYDVNYGPAPIANRMYHMVGVHTGGSAAGARNILYVDGSQYNAITTAASVAASNVSLYFGTINNGMPPLTGTLANIRIYNRALSRDEVRMLYSQPLAGAYNTVRKNFFIYPSSTPKQTRRSVVQAMNQIKQSTSTYPIQFLMLDSSNHISPKTGLTPTVKISKNGGAFTSPAGAVTELGLGWYQVAGNATDSNTLGPLLLNATAGGADPTDMRYEVVSHDPFVFPTPLDASGTRSAVGLASANLDTQLSAIPVSTRTALGMATNNLDAQLAAIPNANANADALLDRSNAIWTGWTVRKVLRVIAAVMAGKLTGANTSTKRFRDFLDTKDVVIATTAASGRTSITLDAS